MRRALPEGRTAGISSPSILRLADQENFTGNPGYSAFGAGRPIPHLRHLTRTGWSDSFGEPLPPLGLVADVGVEIFDLARGQPRAQPTSAALPATLARNYEDHVLGKIYGDWSFERAKDALKLYPPGRERTRGFAFLINQLRQRMQIDGVEMSPAVIRSMLEVAPEETLRRGRDSLQNDG